jgi:hypothetical protein
LDHPNIITVYNIDTRRDFGNRLKAIRLARKLTQEEFGELIGISVDFASLIERGINARGAGADGGPAEFAGEGAFDFRRTTRSTGRRLSPFTSVCTVKKSRIQNPMHHSRIR